MVLVQVVQCARRASGRYLPHSNELRARKIVRLGQDGGRGNPAKLRRAFVAGYSTAAITPLVKRGAYGAVGGVGDGTARVGQVLANHAIFVGDDWARGEFWLDGAGCEHPSITGAGCRD